MTSEQLAERCEVNAAFIRQIENATRQPSLRVFVRICNELQVSPNFILADSLVWEEEDRIAEIDKKLRALSPREFNLAIETIDTLIGGLMKDK